MALDLSARYPGQVDADAAYPQGKARNVTSAGDGTGTPWEKDFANDLFGLHQASLYTAGIQPSNTPDSATVSQYLLAQQRIFKQPTLAVAISESTETTGASSYLSAVAWSGSLFCAVSENADIFTSPDGVSWTSRTPAGAFAGLFRGLAWNGSVFCVVGSGGEIQTSPDGITWTQRTAAGSYAGTFESLVWGNSLFCAVGYNGEIQTSPDGITWTQRTAAGSYADRFRGVAARPGLFVAVGHSGEIQTSPDGITWTARTPADSYTDNFKGVASNGSTFVACGAVGGSDGVVQRSFDGVTWASVPFTFTDEPVSMSWTGSAYLMGESELTAWISAGGLEWSKALTGASVDHLSAVEGDGVTIVVGGPDLNRWRSQRHG